MSKIRQNFHADSEALINKQINMALYASYVYQSMATHFSRDDIAKHGFANRFRRASLAARDEADRLIGYQTKRGGKVVFADIAKPSSDDWGTPFEAVEASLELEKTVNGSFLEMHKVADTHCDPALTHFLEGDFLKSKVETNKEISDLLAKMKIAGDGLGLHMIDQQLK